MKFNWVVYALSSVVFSILYTRTSYDKSEDWGEFLVQGFDTKLDSLISLNLGFSIAVLVVKAIEKIFFQEFRKQETNKLLERLTNYVLIKIVFIVGAIIGPTINELFVWGIWFGIMGFLNLSSLLCRDRFEHLSSINSNETTLHVRILTLLGLILFVDLLLFSLVLTQLFEVGIAVLALLSYECLTIFLNTIQTITKYLLYLTRKDEIWEPRGKGYYYTELITDTLLHLITLVNYCQIFYIHGISLTLIDAVLFLNVRTVVGTLWENFISLKNYRKLAKLMSAYQTLTHEELLLFNDNCAICREPMSVAKRLPCSHIFHENCLQMWLQHCLSSPSCPTCRCLLLSHNHVVFNEPQNGDNVFIIAENNNNNNNGDENNDINNDDNNNDNLSDEGDNIMTVDHYEDDNNNNSLRSSNNSLRNSNNNLNNYFINNNNNYLSPINADNQLKKSSNNINNNINFENMGINNAINELKEKKEEEEEEVIGFAETAEQRKKQLQQRKRQLLLQSKRRFLKKQLSESNCVGDSDEGLVTSLSGSFDMSSPSNNPFNSNPIHNFNNNFVNFSNNQNFNNFVHHLNNNNNNFEERNISLRSSSDTNIMNNYLNNNNNNIHQQFSISNNNNNFLNQNNNFNFEENSIDESKMDSITLRRRKMLMAAEKRLQQTRLTNSDSSLLQNTNSDDY